jgi:hypothetical protein
MLFPSKLGGFVPNSDPESVRWNGSSEKPSTESDFLGFALPDPFTTRLGMGELTLRALTASTRLVSAADGEVPPVELSSVVVDISSAAELVVSDRGVCIIEPSPDSFCCWLRVGTFSFEARTDATLAGLVKVLGATLSFPADAATYVACQQYGPRNIEATTTPVR